MVMTVANRRESLILFIGDLVIFVATLWLTLFIRYADVPTVAVFVDHLLPFSILFFVWFGVFFISGLYEKHTSLFRRRLPIAVFTAQMVNAIIAVLFFYLIPYFGIAPKTNLLLYIVLSFPLVLLWRNYAPAIVGVGKKSNAILIGLGPEMRELRDEVNTNSRYRFRFVSSIDLQDIDGINIEDDVVKVVYEEEVSAIAIDLRSDAVEPMLPHLYNLIFSKVRFIDANRLYEDIFDRVPVSLLKYNWFLENISLSPHSTYDAVKRMMDIVVASIVGVVSLLIYPIVYVLIKLDDGGPLFIMQERVGKNCKLIRTYKFRSMSRNEVDLNASEKNVVTKVGALLRKTRLDELPQLWSVVRGDLSLIGPRPELPSGVHLYEQTIPYYNIRHLIKPGLSGWAQLYHDNHPHHGVDVDETKVKLSYDLYYIKNRSLVLDVIIALKTLKELALRKGR